MRQGFLRFLRYLIGALSMRVTSKQKGLNPIIVQDHGIPDGSDTKTQPPWWTGTQCCYWKHTKFQQAGITLPKTCSWGVGRWIGRNIFFTVKRLLQFFFILFLRKTPFKRIVAVFNICEIISKVIFHEFICLWVQAELHIFT